MFELRRSGMSRACKRLRDNNPHAAPTELVGLLGNLPINMTPLRGSGHHHDIQWVKVPGGKAGRPELAIARRLSQTP